MALMNLRQTQYPSLDDAAWRIKPARILSPIAVK